MQYLGILENKDGREKNPYCIW